MTPATMTPELATRVPPTARAAPAAAPPDDAPDISDAPLLSLDEAVALLSDVDLNLHFGSDDASALPCLGAVDPIDEQPQPPPGDSTGKRDAKRRKQPSVKEELAYLREHVFELEAQLRALRSSGSAADASAALSLSTAAAWEKVAERQRTQRQKAEVENAKLRELLEGQLRVATSLERILRKRPSASWLETFELEGDRTKRVRFDADNSDDDATSSDSSSTDACYDVLTDDLTDVYAQLESVLIDSGFAARSTETSHVRVRTDASDCAFMEMLDAKVLPFDLATAASAVWQFMTAAQIALPNGVYCARDTVGETVRAHVQVTLPLRRTGVPLRVSLVVRRVVQAQRVVMFWSSVSASKRGDKSAQRIRIRERGWCALKPLPQPRSSRDAASACLVQVVARCAPELHSAASSADREHAGVLTDVMMATYHRNVQTIHQIIEDFLMTKTPS